MTPILTAIGVVCVIATAIGIGVLVIKAKLNSATKRYLGMNLQQTADLIGRGLKDEVTTPRSISNVSAMYKPQLMRDFPDMTYERFLEMANSALVSILTAIEKESTSGIEFATDTLKQQIYDRICDNHDRNIIEHFDDIKLHRTVIANYKTTDDTATAVFEISFQCVHYLEGKDKKIPENPQQFAASVTLGYGREYREDSRSITYSHNCPNCGAPVYAVGGKMMKCPYCGTGVTEEVYKSWSVSAYRFI